MIRENGSQRNAITFLTVVLSATCAALILLGWAVWNSYEENKITRERNSQTEELRGIIIHLDEVLTMSARMAAATGDLRWEKRYRIFEPQLAAAIKKAIRLAPTAYNDEAAAQTDAANIKLVAMENQGFDLIRQGRADEAKMLLFSDEYEKQKRIYARGMTNLNADLSVIASMNLQNQQRQTLLRAVFVLLLIPLLIIVWFVAFRVMRGWAKTLISKKELEKEIVERKRVEEERGKLVADLQKTLSEVKTLQGFLPICSHCRKIRDDKGYWNQIESYIHEHSDTEFSHGICPECAEKHHPDMDLYGDEQTKQ
ncbi:MAG: hypothetical protein JRF69_09165 [Deltaproteobacteria bacterium]|nr:hypothetical protein [Deltaproteobacteria bacterium]